MKSIIQTLNESLIALEESKKDLSFSEYMLSLRLAFFLTRKVAANLLNIKYQALYYIEYAGIGRLTRTQLKNIASFYSIDYEWLKNKYDESVDTRYVNRKVKQDVVTSLAKQDFISS